MRAEPTVYEQAALRLILGAGLPKPEVQLPLMLSGKRMIADIAWPSQRVMLEIDGNQHYSDAGQIADDLRDAAAVAAGWVVIRAENRDVELRIGEDSRPFLAALRVALDEAVGQRRATNAGSGTNKETQRMRSTFYAKRHAARAATQEQERDERFKATRA